MTANETKETSKDSIYKCSSKLEEKGYLHTDNGLLCPLEDNRYLEVTRIDGKYSYSLVEYENSTIKYISPSYSCKEAITEEKNSRTKKLIEYWSQNENTTDIEPILSTIAVDLKNEDNFAQVNKTFNIYEEQQKKARTYIDDSLDKAIEHRRNPKLNVLTKKRANEVEKELKEKGLIKFLEEQLDALHVGKNTNMYRELFGAFKIMIGEGSYIFEIIADSGEGKSLEQGIVFSKIIPQQYIIKINSITISSFTRYADKNIFYFDRTILFVGDLGSRKSYIKMEDLFNIYKVLITEHEYKRDLSEKNEEGKYSNKELHLKVDSIGLAYSSTKNYFTDGDNQLESRTISATPYGSKEEEVLEYMILTDKPIYPKSKEKKKAEQKLKKFQSYLIKCASMKITIINPYGHIFKKYALKSDVPKRELKQSMELFDSYCRLTYFNCDETNGHLVASEKQINEYMKEVALENSLIPYESDFLKMIMGKNNTELTIINTAIKKESDNENTNNPLDEYYTNVLESFEDIKADSFADLNDYEEKKAIKRLLKLYKLGGTSSAHEDDVFFRISDIRRHYSKYKAYKNIDNVQALIHRLVKKGYIDSIEYQDGKQNIYYLTEQCNDIVTPFKLTKEDEKSAEEFLKKVGVE